MPRQLGASLQSERGSLPEQRETDMSLRFTAAISPFTASSRRRPRSCRCMCGGLRDDPERAAAESEVIAHHFTGAGLDELAIEWWGKAGDQALRRSAFQEATPLIWPIERSANPQLPPPSRRSAVSASRRFCSLMGQGAHPFIDALGCLGSLRARWRLMG
jgi:hypothetical protein